MFIVFFFKQKTAYEMRISDWSSDVCSSDLIDRASLVTVCAAAGSGKTTAMLYWAEELQKAERPLLWLAARAGISNLSTFQNALIAAGVAAGLDWKDLEEIGRAHV